MWIFHATGFMCCMIKTCMEDNEVYKLPNIQATSNQGACSVVCSVPKRNHQIHNTPQPEQILTSEAGEALTASSCSEILANVPISVGYATFECHAVRVEYHRQALELSGPYFCNLLSPRHSCNQGLHFRQDSTLFPSPILQSNP